MLSRVYRRIVATAGLGAQLLLESRAGSGEFVRHFNRAKLSDRDDDLIHEQMSDRFGDGYMHQERKRKHTIRDARLCQQIDEAWEDVVMRTPHLHDTLMGDHSLEKTGMQVSDKGRRCTIFYSCDPASQAYVANYFATASRWLSHRIGEQLRVKYRPRVKFEQDGLSADGEQLLEALSSANMDTADARTPHSDSPGHDRSEEGGSAPGYGGEGGPQASSRRRRSRPV